MPLESKTSECLFNACIDFQKPLALLGHRGIAVQHFTWDRALWSSMSNLCRRYHTHILQELPEEEELPRRLRYLLTWPLTTPCG